MKRHFLAALLSTALLLTACGREAHPSSSASSAASSGTVSLEETPRPAATLFTLAVYPEFSLHPTLAANRANLTLAPLLYEGLFSVDASFQAQPVLCRSYTVSEDKLTWTLTLQPGVTFSDGTPLTGQTVADALNLARSEQGRYKERLAVIAAAAPLEDAPDQLTITLRRSNGSLPLLLDIPIALGGGDRPAGTGPYVLSENGDSLSLTAREGWWQKERPLPAADIPLHSVHRSEELIYAFDAGEVSLVDVDLMATNAMGYGGNYQTWDYPTTDFLYLGFNTQEGPCRTLEVRQCLALAVDRNTIASTIYANHAVPAALPVHPSSPLYSRSAAAAVPGYDPEALAARLGELRGLDGELIFLVNSENTAKASAAQLIAYQLEAAGLNVTLQQLPFEDYQQALNQGAFDLYLGETVFTADFDLAPLLSSTGTLNYGGWRLEEADSCLWNLYGAVEDKGNRAEELFALLNVQTPIVPIIFKNGSVLTQWGRLSGLTPVRGDVFYGLENWTIS
jgi:peptide/nickel transport system substrate-binding protein